MWKKFLMTAFTLLVTFSTVMYINYFTKASSTSTIYTVGDTVYYGSDTFTYVGTDGDDNLLLLNKNSIEDNITWNTAKTGAVNYKNSLGNIGKTLVTSALPNTNDLQHAAVLNNGIDELYSSVPKIASNWWLGDIDLQADNMARFLSENNKREHDQSYQEYVNITNGACQTPTQHTTPKGTDRKSVV